MTPSAMTMMTRALTGAPLPAAVPLQSRPAPAPAASNKAVGPTAAMRELLARGPATAAQLARAAGVPSARVGALMKYDRRLGRVTFANGLWDLVPAFDEELHRRIREARVLLARHGYAVTRLDGTE